MTPQSSYSGVAVRKHHAVCPTFFATAFPFVLFSSLPCTNTFFHNLLQLPILFSHSAPAEVQQRILFLFFCSCSQPLGYSAYIFAVWRFYYVWFSDMHFHRMDRLVSQTLTCPFWRYVQFGLNAVVKRLEGSQASITVAPVSRTVDATLPPPRLCYGASLRHNRE